MSRYWYRMDRAWLEANEYAGCCFGYLRMFTPEVLKEAREAINDAVELAGAPASQEYRHDKEENAEALGWTKPEFDDWDWPTTHVVREIWSSIGHHNTMGRMAYRTTAHLEAVPTGRKAFLWVGSTDGSAKLFVNGQHVRYVTPDKGEVKDAFSGYCQPAQFDVTGVVKPGVNQVTILCERNWLHELGTGGLMGPVMLWREK